MFITPKWFFILIKYKYDVKCESDTFFDFILMRNSVFFFFKYGFTQIKCISWLNLSTGLLFWNVYRID